jgi:hypothetical protein
MNNKNLKGSTVIHSKRLNGNETDKANISTTVKEEQQKPQRYSKNKKSKHAVQFLICRAIFVLGSS